MALSRTNILSEQSATNILTAGFTTSAQTTTAGQWLVVIGKSVSGSAISAANLTIADSKGNVYTSRLTFDQSGWGADDAAIRVWTAPVTSAGSTTWTIDAGADSTDQYCLTVLSYAGADTSGLGTSASNLNSGIDGALTLTLAAAPALASDVIGVFLSDNSGAGVPTQTPGATFAELYNVGTAGHAGSEIEVRTNSASTSVDWVDINDTANVIAASIAIAFEVKAAVGVGWDPRSAARLWHPQSPRRVLRPIFPVQGSGAFDQTVNAQVAALVLGTVAGVVTAGPVTTTAQVATVTLTAVPGTLAEGNATVTAQVATLALTANPGTVSAVVTVTAQVAPLTLTAIPGTVTGGPATVTAQVATLTLTPVVGTLVKGGATLTAQIATLTLTANPSVPIAGAATTSAAVAALALSGVAGTVTGGPVTVTAQVGSIALTAVPGSISSGGGSPQTVNAQIATLTLTAIAGTATGGLVTTSAQIATLTLTAVPGTELAGNFTVTAQVATITLTAVQGTLVKGNATVTAQVATVTLTARQGTLTTGPVSIAATPALLTLTAIPGVVFAGTLLVIVGQAISGRDPLVLRGADPAPVFGRDPGVVQGADPRPVYGRNPTPEGG